jgi:hypothetical protein
LVVLGDEMKYAIAKYNKGLLKRRWFCVLFFIIYFLLLVYFSCVGLIHQYNHRRDLSGEGLGFIMMFVFFFLFHSLCGNFNHSYQS